ncbi:hypothetical protein [Quadrisphaera granulorum]|nr:hypothetical protein [Quadrisphaera granulorum]
MTRAAGIRSRDRAAVVVVLAAVAVAALPVPQAPTTIFVVGVR